MYPIGEMVQVVVDRPLGSTHPHHPDMVYPVNYGYVPGVLAGDGEEQDVYILGVQEPLQRFQGRVMAVIRRLDDCEDKWVAAPADCRLTRAEIEAAVHFTEQYFRHTVEMEDSP